MSRVSYFDHGASVLFTCPCGQRIIAADYPTCLNQAFTHVSALNQDPAHKQVYDAVCRRLRRGTAA